MANGQVLTQVRLSKERELRTVVENRRAYTLNNCELNVFETYQRCNKVPLKFNDFVITNMLRGKKVMHLFNSPGFDYLPGETVIVPPAIQMLIDFPDATLDQPTQCTALAIDRQQIINTVDYLNEHHPRENNEIWQLDFTNYHFLNDAALSATINKLIAIGSSDEIHKDVLADLTLKELLIRIMQTQHLILVEKEGSFVGNERMTVVVNYIREHLAENLHIDTLCKKTGMSKPVFFRVFKRELGVSPVEFVIRERIRLAKKYLSNNSSIKEACFAAGFNSLNYFFRMFKKHEGITPGAYQTIT
ncbi:AraC family transcriptional regulator [Olivibacter sp. SDN3]|uniref:AraC family transcriptional regulator n=1 Tax=Olivibacter sp. SDN3 TaxID=2764720 RepID=UPI001650DC09|nr:AraC family transcriptional regulator [Olivibacter sp. SDN3]QNL47820.1 AraC family transcriptional regulator [Olivibacter sp. SDN3]